MLGSWITHSTTANVYQEFTSQQNKLSARMLPTSGTAVSGRFPDPLLVSSLRSFDGPISDSWVAEQSPALHLFPRPNEIGDDGGFSAPSALIHPKSEPHFQSLSQPLSKPSSEQLNETAYKIKKGDTLGNIFRRLGMGYSLPHEIGQHPTASRLTRLSVGATLFFGRNESDQLQQIRYPINPLQEFVVSVDGDQVSNARVVDLPFETAERVVSGEIHTSLYEAAIEAGLNIEQVMEMVQIFGWDIDFVLDIRAGDTFHVVFEIFQNKGETLARGAILAAEFTTQNRTHRTVRFSGADGEPSYYNPEGESMLGMFLRSPVEFSRISSRFGKRKHPILKQWRAHKGVDYAARRGTPIRATADGKVTHVGTKGSYGKTVILRHANRFTTLYAHMNGYAKGIRSGTRVSQGDVIGYIGSTGLATGPHLHYEFRLDGVHRNPLTFKTPKASAVSDADRPAFERQSRKQLAQLKTISTEYRIARGDISERGAWGD